MGQRLVITVHAFDEDIATIYYHWSAYTTSALDEAQKILKHVKWEDTTSKDELILRIVRFMESNGGCIDFEDKQYTGNDSAALLRYQIGAGKYKQLLMRCSFGYTVKSPYVERRVKYYDENGIYDESVQSDDELIVIGEKLRNGGYRYNEELGKAETAMFETEPNNPQYKEILARLNRVRDKYGIKHWDEKERVM